jgi:RHS repeat-associated protein
MSAEVSGTPIYTTTYTRDKLGRITTKVEMIQGVTKTYDYAYDPAGRLDTVTIDGILEADYDYDLNGNRLSKTTPGGTETGTYDDQDRMLTYGGAIYTYTANGEMQSKTDGQGVTTFAYDVFGNLLGISLPEGAEIGSILDSKNRRVGKSVGGVLTQQFLWQSRLAPAAELDGAGNLVSRFVYAARSNVPDYIVRAGEEFRVIYDHLGTPRLVIGSTSGVVVQRVDSDDWGVLLAVTSPGWQPFGFSGGLLGLTTGHVRFGTRDLQNVSGGWMTRDPLGFTALESNLYAYAENDPVNSTDPLGLASFFFGVQLCLAGPGGGLDFGLGIAFNFGLNGERLDFGLYSTEGVAAGLDASAGLVGGYVDGNLENLGGSSSSTGFGGGPFATSTIRNAATGVPFGATLGVGPSAPFGSFSITRDETQLFNMGLLTDLIRDATDDPFDRGGGGLGVPSGPCDGCSN